MKVVKPKNPFTGAPQAGHQFVYVRANWLERLVINRRIRKGRYDMLYAPHLPGPAGEGAQYIMRPHPRLRAAAARTPPPPGLLIHTTRHRFNLIDAAGAVAASALYPYDPLVAAIALQPFVFASVYLGRKAERQKAIYGIK